mmetsp:Transcript_2355/g.5086  ORF Transcript_2355/g.5086 Transcript_2355/m.5086 type:complete len:380 (+) Transcript_2355:246-1385(+)|eukprot:CAMPEP_0171344872 /NCGR_PEP_ID=MMETSP0878-20121228/20370_1 /TAXON_ID=67004 /ORGANISM="Thalassiosira weissflogii, Strain CCMP1336" /LENGTH=379 /DNA_ID=CAMNT_0011848161 /DNA_START=159 /DNA_END=1298 /DNA_ORIENTATION=+
MSSKEQKNNGDGKQGGDGLKHSNFRGSMSSPPENRVAPESSITPSSMGHTDRYSTSRLPQTANTVANSKRRTSHAHFGHPIFPVRNPTPEDLRTARQLKEYLKKKYGFTTPDRGNIDDPSIIWKEGKPDYTIANLHYFLGKTKNHAPGSLEMTVENLVKTWEMEATHKEFYQWITVNKDNYQVQANGGKIFSSEESSWVGNYNWLMSACKKELYDASNETFESSHGKFRYAFPEGFPWEVLEVLAGPPKVVFTWRHWAVFSGEYCGHRGSGERVTMTGIGMAEMSDDMKIQKLEIYFDPDGFMETLTGGKKCRDGKERGIAFGEPIAGGEDNLSRLMTEMVMTDFSDNDDDDEDDATSKRSNNGEHRTSGGKCPFAGSH